MTDREALQQVLFLSLLQFSCGQLNSELPPSDRNRLMRILGKLSKGPSIVKPGMSAARLFKEILPLLEEIAGIEPPTGPETIWDRLDKDPV